MRIHARITIARTVARGPDSASACETKVMRLGSSGSEMEIQGNDKVRKLGEVPKSSKVQATEALLARKDLSR